MFLDLRMTAGTYIFAVFQQVIGSTIQRLAKCREGLKTNCPCLAGLDYGKIGACDTVNGK